MTTKKQTTSDDHLEYFQGLSETDQLAHIAYALDRIATALESLRPTQRRIVLKKAGAR
jgi:hypothetical protein